ncbi:MAG: peptide ABC transporter substrate-binding protein [Vulcanimicrobiaceae bacterium]
MARPSLAAAATCVSLVAALAGCSRVGDGSGGGANGRHHAWTKPGTLRIVNLVEPDTLNPLLGNSQIDSDLANLWGGMLLNWSDANEFVPELATEVPTLANHGVSADGKTIVYHLRRHVTWHDGKPFTAADVVFTWHAVLNKKNNVGSTVGYDIVERIDARDPYTIAVHLKAAWAPFVASFFAPSATPYPILPAHLLARYADINRVPYNRAPIGTGPFTVERWTRGSKIVFRANPHYWRGAPKLQSVTYEAVPNENTVETLLQTHAADLDYNSPASKIAQTRAIEGYVTTLTPFTQYGQLALNARTPALSDVRVRSALWYALDVPSLLRDVTHDVDIPGDTDQPSFSWAYDPAVPHHTFDPKRAAALLDAAGWKRGADGMRARAGTRLSLTAAGVTGSAVGDAVEALAQRNWHDAGIDVGIKNYTSSLYFASYGENGILQNGKFDIAFYSWVNGVDPDDSVQYMCDQMPPKGQNVFHYCDPAFDRQERIALASNDRATRKRAYAAAQRIWATDVPAIVTWFVRRISVANDDLKGYRPAHAVSSFWNPYEWSI